MSDSPDLVTDEHRFPCDTCGSDMRFDPSSGDLSCDHCGARDAIDGDHKKSDAIQELDFRAAIDQALPAAEIEETRVSKCPSCGAEVALSGADHAGECPFCATPVVADTGEHRQIKPKAVLPFVLPENAARDAMTEWLGKLWFAPNGLQEYARKGRKLQGIYVPYWTFDADTKSTYRGQRGTEYQTSETVVVNGERQTRTKTKVRWQNVRGKVARFFDDVLVLASKSLPKKYTDALEPWDLADLQPYQPHFLAGYRAEGYGIALEDSFQIARAKMDRQIDRDVRFDIGGDRQRVDNISTEISNVTFKHVLLPVWMAAYKYRGKTYRFVVNGQSGRVRGERPWSAWKIAIAVIVGVAVAAGVGYLVAINQ